MSFHRSRHCALFELLTQRPNHTIAATTPHPLNASALAQVVTMPVSHGTFQPCAGMSVASVSSFIGRSQPNNYSACRFHTAHRQAPCSGLTLPRCRNAVAYIWCGIAVLPCFSASGKVPVTRCGLPLRGTYAAYVPSGSHRREVRGVLLVPCGRCDLPPRIVGCNERTAYNNSP